MYRTLLASVFALLIVTVASADLRPPMGVKTVQLDHKITTDKEYPDYLFFTVTGGKGQRAKLTPVKLDPKNPATLSGAGRSAGIGRQGSLVAVPKDAEKKYDSEEKFHAAIKDRNVEGLIATKVNLDSQAAIKETDKRTVVVYEVIVEKVDPKEGIVVKLKRDEPAPEKKEGEKKDSPDEDSPDATASTPRGGMLVAGLAAALAVMLGGLWLVGRKRKA